MDDGKIARIKSLDKNETEILHQIFRDPGFEVRELAKKINWSYGTIQTYKTSINKKLLVPSNVENEKKRGWIVENYSEEYEYLFKRGEWEAKQEPEIYIKPPEPVVEKPSKPQPTNKELISQIQSMYKTIVSQQNEIHRLKVDYVPPWAAVIIIIVCLLAGFFFGAYFEHYSYGFLVYYFPFNK
jgi:hypothetical protein